MLLEHKICVHTDHKNLTYEDTKYSNDRVLRQRLVLEEFNPRIVLIAGKKKIAADTLIQNPQEEKNQVVNETLMESYQMQEMDNELVLVSIDYSMIHAA